MADELRARELRALLSLEDGRSDTVATAEEGLRLFLAFYKIKSESRRLKLIEIADRFARETDA